MINLTMLYGFTKYTIQNYLNFLKHNIQLNLQFKSPIVNVWKFESGHIESIDLFAHNHNMNSGNPLVYLGMHQKQVK